MVRRPVGHLAASRGVAGADRPGEPVGRLLDGELQLPAGRRLVGVPPAPAQLAGEGAELVERQRPVVERVAERGDQPQRAEPAGGRAAPAAVGAAARPGPRQPGDGLGRRRGRPAAPPSRRARAAPPRRRPRRRRPRRGRSSSSSTARRAGARRARRSGRRAASGSAGGEVDVDQRRRGRGRRELGAVVAVRRPAGTSGSHAASAYGRSSTSGSAATDVGVDAPRRAAPARGRRSPPADRARAAGPARPTCGAGRRPRSAGRS